MLEMNLREMILWSHLQPNICQNELALAVSNRVKTHPGEVNQPGLLGLTPCHLVMLGSHWRLIEILVLEGHGDLLLESTAQHTPWSLATERGLQDRLERLQRQLKQQHEESKKPVGAALKEQTTLNRTRTLSRSSRRSMFFSSESNVTPRMVQVPKLKQVAEFDDALSSSDDEELELVKRVAKLNVKDKNQCDFTIYLFPLLKAVNADRGSLVGAYLQEGFLIQQLTTLMDCGAFAYAYRQGLGNVFSLLAIHGESIRQDISFNQQRSLMESLLASSAFRQMLLVAQNNVLEKISWGELKKLRVEILGLSAHYNELLSQCGLEPKMSAQQFTLLTVDKLTALAAAKSLPLALMITLHRICSCVNGAHQFEPEEVANQIAGLCAQYKPLEVIAALMALYSDFSKAQKLISLYIFKEMVIYNTEISNHDLRFFSSIILPILQTTSEQQEIVEILRLIMALRYKASQSLLDNYFYLESIIQRHVLFPEHKVFRLLFQVSNEDSDKRAVALANGLRAHSLMLFHNLDIKELSSMDWKAKNKDQLAPSVLDIEQYFNRLSNWVTWQILQYKDIKQRARIVKLCIKVIHELLESEVPDYTSAMAVFSALSQASVMRLTDTFSLLSKKTRKLRDKLEEKLSPHKNFIAMREVLDKNPYAIPYIGLITADLTFAQENQDSNARMSITGKVIRHLVHKKGHLCLMNLPITMDLGTYFAQASMASENDLYQQSLVLEPRPFQLSPDIDFEQLLLDMRALESNEGPLKIVLHGVALESKAVLEPLTQWLKEQYIQGKIAISTFSEIVSLAHNIVSPDERFKFNAAYYERLKAPREEIVVQFRLKQKEHQDSDDEQAADAPRLSDKKQIRK